MNITVVETIRLREFGNLIWVRIHTDEGLVGLGETFMGASAVDVSGTLGAKVAPGCLRVRRRRSPTFSRPSIRPSKPRTSRYSPAGVCIL